MKKHIYICNVKVAEVTIKKRKVPMDSFGTLLTHELFINDTIVYRGTSLKDCKDYAYNLNHQIGLQ